MAKNGIVWAGRADIATVCPRGRAAAKGDAEAEANARLIAAAPELLEFVRAYLDDADCGDGGTHTEDMSHGECWHCTASRLVRMTSRA